MTQLPPGWAQTSVGSVSQFVRGVTYKRDEARSENAEGFLPLLRATNIDGSATTNETQLVYVPESVVSTDQVLRHEDIVMATSSGSISVVGKSATWLGGKPTTFGAFCGVLRATDAVHPRYLAHYVRSAHVRSRWSELASGTNINNLKRDHVLETPVPLPPLAEQQRIVEAIEERFTRLDCAEASLRQATGRTELLRRSHARELTTCGPLHPLEDLLAAPLSNGRSVTTRPGGFPVLRLTAIHTGVVDPSMSKEGDWTAAEARRFLVAEGDYLVARGNGSLRLVGRGALVGPSPPAVAYPDTLIRVRCDPARVSCHFLRLVWDSPPVRQQIEMAAKTTAGIYKVNQTDLRNVKIPVPPLDVQLELVARFESLNITNQRTTSALESALGRSSQLRRSILQQAFKGELVPQDPGDEPVTTRTGLSDAGTSGLQRKVYP